jgi:peptidoglycan/LPS O-acetylase OafA/YrhL
MKPEFKINNFDLLRIFAATEVLIQHSFFHLKLPQSGWLSILEYFPGVPIFFVISGFLISASYERSNDLKTYFSNRGLRILPGLWCCILLTIITASVFGNINFFNIQTPLWLLCQMSGIIYTPQFLLNYGFGSYNGALWTIPIEMQFYIILPVIYFLLRGVSKKNTWFFILWALFLVLAHVFRVLFPDMLVTGAHSSTMVKLLQYSFLPHFYMFLGGVLLQRLHAFRSVYIFGKGLYWLIGYMLFMHFTPYFELKEIIGKIVLSFCTISLAYTLPGISNKLLKGNDISYGIYIYHGVILNIAVQRSMYDYTGFFMVFLSTYIIAYLSWNFIEKPMLRKKKHTINTANSMQKT